MPQVTIPISMRQGLTTSHAMSVGVAVAISTGMASGLNVPNALGRAVLLALHAGAPGNAFKTVIANQHSGRYRGGLGRVRSASVQKPIRHVRRRCWPCPVWS